MGVPVLRAPKEQQAARLPAVQTARVAVLRRLMEATAIREIRAGQETYRYPAEGMEPTADRAARLTLAFPIIPQVCTSFKVTAAMEDMGGPVVQAARAVLVELAEAEGTARIALATKVVLEQEEMAASAEAAVQVVSEAVAASVGKGAPAVTSR